MRLLAGKLWADECKSPQKLFMVTVTDVEGKDMIEQQEPPFNGEPSDLFQR